MSVVKVTLLTRRKNEIRVHFAENNHPVVGDPKKCGRPDSARARMASHAKFLAFPHPHGGGRITFDTGIPEYFQRLADGLDDMIMGGRLGRLCRNPIDFARMSAVQKAECTSENLRIAFQALRNLQSRICSNSCEPGQKKICSPALRPGRENAGRDAASFCQQDDCL